MISRDKITLSFRDEDIIMGISSLIIANLKSKIKIGIRYKEDDQ